jgi:hypothetical protein
VIRERRADLLRFTGEAQENRSSHTEAETSSIHESIEPAGDPTPAGLMGRPTDRIAESETVASRVELGVVGIGFQFVACGTFGGWHGCVAPEASLRLAARLLL